MSEKVTIEPELASRGHLTAARWISLSRRLLYPDGLRWLIDGLEGAAVIGTAVLARQVVPSLGLHVALPQASMLGLGAILLAALIRWATRHPINDLAYPAGQPPWAAVLALLTAVAFCGLFWWGAAIEAGLEPHMPPAVAVFQWIMLWAGSAALASYGLRAGAVWLVRRLDLRRRALVIGEGSACHRFLDATHGRQDFPWSLLGVFDIAGTDDLAILRQRVSDSGSDIVVLVSEDGPGAPLVPAVCEALEDQLVSLCLAINWVDLVRPPDGALRCGSYALQGLLRSPLDGLGGLSKRLFDLGLGTFALVVLSPVILAAACAIVLESPGPVLFRQQRFGMGGQPISVLKFRTMRHESCDVSGGVQTATRDARVTRVGRLLRRCSIDELPQLINVLRGEMSLVGPRPHPLGMTIEDRLYGDAVAHYRARHLVRPGITGWAQVNGSRGAVDDMEEARRRVELDLYYVNNWSLGLDLLILIRTVTGAFLSLRAD